MKHQFFLIPIKKNVLKQYQRYHLWFDLLSDWNSNQWYCTSPLEGSYGVAILGHYCVLDRIPIPMFAFSFQVFCFLCQMSAIANNAPGYTKGFLIYAAANPPRFLDLRLTANLSLVLITIEGKKKESVQPTADQNTNRHGKLGRAE